MSESGLMMFVRSLSTRRRFPLMAQLHVAACSAAMGRIESLERLRGLRHEIEVVRPSCNDHRKMDLVRSKREEDSTALKPSQRVLEVVAKS